jgi:hypothetical protein
LVALAMRGGKTSLVGARGGSRRGPRWQWLLLAALGIGWVVTSLW